MEIWKSIKGYEGLYQISNKGRVLSRGKKYCKIFLTSKNYCQVSLCKNSKQKSFRLHRLVAEAFVPNPNNLPQVNHIDGDKLNNNDWNLEWCDNKHNSIHSFQIGLQSRTGEKNHRTKLKENDIKIIRKARNDGTTLEELAKIYNINKSAISKITTKKTWSHVSI